MTAYISFRVIFGILVGIAFYSMDRRFGVGSYKWWHDMTHQNPMPEADRRGFIFNKPTKVKAFAALLLSSLISVVSVYTAPANSLAELVLWAVTMPAILIGFLIGPHFYKIWQRRDQVFESVDKWERGEIDLTDELKAKTAEISGSVRETVAAAVEKIQHEDKKAPEPPKPAETQVSQDQAEEMMNRFIRDRKG